MHNAGMQNDTTKRRRNPMLGLTTAGIESALCMHIIDGVPMRVAAKACDCSLSGLFYAKRKHAERIKSMANQSRQEGGKK